MMFDNRTADLQSDSHTLILRRVEGFEKLIRSLRFASQFVLGRSLQPLSSNRKSCGDLLCQMMTFDKC
jgi:hypothetical protein